MLKSYQLQNEFTTQEIEAIEKALLDTCSKDEAVAIIENEDFILYKDCYTLQDVVDYRRRVVCEMHEFSVDAELTIEECLSGEYTAQDIEINSVYYCTEVGIIILN